MGRLIGKVQLALGLTIMLSAEAAIAQTVSIRARTVWQVQLSEKGHAPKQVNQIRRQEKYFTSALLPTKAYSVFSQSAPDPWIDKILKNGVLIGLESDVPIGCSNAKKVTGVMDVIARDSNSARLCLVDLRSIGRFTHHTVISSEAAGILKFDGAISKITQLAQEIQYTALDPKLLPNLPKVVVSYPHYASLAKTLFFQFSVMDHEDRAYLKTDPDPRIGRYLISLPFESGKLSARFLGIKFSLLRAKSGPLTVGVEDDVTPACVFSGRSPCWQSANIDREVK